MLVCEGCREGGREELLYILGSMCFCVGSGSLAAMSVFEDRFKPNMEVCRMSVPALRHTHTNAG